MKSFLPWKRKAKVQNWILKMHGYFEEKNAIAFFLTGRIVTDRFEP
jgi:hypothetical protein